ncbi:peroxiredoxin-like family protein [Maridesulfovibrio frigidus]|uniref:peroxiredoxin-like family protein n=1 Tax=Maridesulfovibrio frigidus TaxID=340956 RepID=UPI0004E1027F|nr:peroxiredoxin-like family protein [Maridesulfovibrio frigidus]
MPNLSEQIADYEVEKEKKVPKEILDVMNKATTELKSSGIEEQSLQTGRKAPAFKIKNHLGEERSLSELIESGPVVLSFYRGGWCPYCNLELAALQRALPEIEAAGAKLVAISPETPDNSLSTREKNEIAFDVLYDEGNKVAESYGLVFTLSDDLRPIYDKFGINIPEFNGEDTFKLPVPATYVISTHGIVAYHFVDADYTKRLEPSDIIKALKEI